MGMFDFVGDLWNGITGETAAEGAGDVIVTTYGVHYEKDTPGSRTATTK